MKYSLRQIRDSLTTEKKRADGIWTTFVLRPLSIPVTWIALRFNLSANMVSYISAFFSIGGGILLSVNGFWMPLAGAVLLNIFSILDCVDGNVARVTDTAGPMGGWADAVMGNVAYTSVFLSTGVYMFLRSGWWPVLLITGFTSSANLFTRVAYQKYRTIEPDKGSDTISSAHKIAENVGITGFLMPLLIVCHLFGGMLLVVWFNAVFYTAGAVITVLKIAHEAN